MKLNKLDIALQILRQHGNRFPNENLGCSFGVSMAVLKVLHIPKVNYFQIVFLLYMVSWLSLN